ncbi:MAG TPA: zinc metallopeptidase [Anaerolineales bacterium]|jgi:hypothetical protein
MFFWDTTYILYMLPGILLTLLAQLWVNSTYNKWSKVASSAAVTGAQAADRLLGLIGMPGVSVEPAQGRLGDHYDPRTKTLRLSPGVGNGQSVAALAITAHEIGHAQQDAEGYGPMRLRSALVPAVNIGSNLGIWMILGGLLLQSFLGTQLATQIAWLGVIFFASGAVFALATLPVELDASRRAHELLQRSGLLTARREQDGARSVLRAAAFTYVAGLAAAILQLLYFVSIVGGVGRRRS